MNKNTLRSLHHFYSESVLGLVLSLLGYVCLCCFENTVFSARFCFSIWIMIYSNRLFMKAWKNNKPTHHALLDVLLVPYEPKKHRFIQISMLSLVWISTFSCMNLAYLITHQKLHLVIAIFYRTLILGGLSFVCTLLSSQATQKKYSLMLVVLAVFYALAHAFSYDLEVMDIWFNGWMPSGLVLASILFAGLAYWLDATSDTEEKYSPSVPVISNNINGILTLSKMAIIKESSPKEAFGIGISLFTIYRLINIILDTFSHAANPTAFGFSFNWLTVSGILFLISLILSIQALKSIYVTKSMLRVVPVRKHQLFHAAVEKALLIPTIILLICTAALWLMKDVYSVEQFFLAAHPYDLIVNAAFLMILPASTFLICFSIYASENRFASAFLLFAAAIAAWISYAVSSLVLLDSLPGRIAILALLYTVPHVLSAILYHKLQNIHS